MRAEGRMTMTGFERRKMAEMVRQAVLVMWVLGGTVEGIVEGTVEGTVERTVEGTVEGTVVDLVNAVKLVRMVLWVVDDDLVMMID